MSTNVPAVSSTRAAAGLSSATRAVATSRVVSVTPVISTTSVVSVTPAAPTTRTTTSHRRGTTSTTRSLAPTTTPTPFDASAENRADTRRTNRILIGIFTTIGVLLLAFVAFQVLRRYRRRRKPNSTPLPPPRRSNMSQIGYRQSRAVSMYTDYPTPDFSQPPSVLNKDNSFGSRSGFIATPSMHSNAASMEMLGVDETGMKHAEGSRNPGHAARESTSEKSITGPALSPNDEEAGRHLSPLGSRSQSPSNLTPPRPASQAQAYRRSESRNRHPRPTSVASTSRHSYLNAPAWHGPQRNSTYVASNRQSYYGNGNHGAPHAPHARERVGLMMPQPLAPELFNYALSGRHDMGLDFTQGWGSQGTLAKGQDSPLEPPRVARTDSWIARCKQILFIHLW